MKYDTAKKHCVIILSWKHIQYHAARHCSICEWAISFLFRGMQFSCAIYNYIQSKNITSSKEIKWKKEKISLWTHY